MLAYSYTYAQNLVSDMKDQLLTPRKGQGLIEYGLIVVLIALAAVAIMGTVGTSISGLFTRANTELVKN